MIQFSGISGKKWPVAFWWLATLFLGLFSILSLFPVQNPWLFNWSLSAIENNGLAWCLSIVLLIIPVKIAVSKWKISGIIPFFFWIILSIPLIQSAREHRKWQDVFPEMDSFKFSQWLFNKVPNAQFTSVKHPWPGVHSSQIYLPEKSHHQHPVVFLFHGGGFFQGHPNWMHQWASSLSQQGIGVISCSYPFAPGANFPDQISSFRDLVNVVKTQKYFPDADTSNFFVAGSSAGGTLALSSAILHPELNFKGIIALYPITDFESFSNQNTSSADLAIQYRGKSSNQEVSPIHQLNKTIPEILVIHGQKDLLVEAIQSERFEQAALSFSPKVYFASLPWAIHNCEYPISGPSGQLVNHLSAAFIRSVAAKSVRKTN